MFGFEISEVTTFAGEPAYILSNGDLLLLSSLLNDVVVVSHNNNTGSTDTTPITPDPIVPDPTDPCPSGDLCECYGIGCGDPAPDITTWYLDYDSDGYHSVTYQAVASPGDKWKTTTSGVDCDDTRPQYTIVCCTKTCESGYKLNVDNCECVLLPPCFGTVKDFETSNSFNSNDILNELNSTLGDFGISTDVMDIIKQMNVFTPETIAAGTDFINFADDLGTIGDVGQVSMDVLEYMDEPSTQNLLKTVLDIAAISLSPAASLAISTFDYYKDNNGDSKLDLLLKAAADAIDRKIDCNLGLGIRNGIF